MVAVGATTVAVTPAAAQQPVGVGPVPITFDLTDQGDRWFDSGLNLFGSRSLAIAVLPRVGSQAGLPGVGGPLLPEDPGGLIKGLTAPLTGGKLGALPDAAPASSPVVAPAAYSVPDGVSASSPGDISIPAHGPGDSGAVQAGSETPLDTLGLGQTLAAVKGIGVANPKAAGLAGKAESLLGELKVSLAGMPSGTPVNLLELPVGIELQGVLDSLADFASEGPGVTVTFNVDPDKSEGIRNPNGLIAPEGASGFPYMDNKGAFFGKKTILLTKPGLYAFQDSVAPYMLGAVVVDDPLTLGLDFGKSLSINGVAKPVASNSDIIQQLVKAFFNVTNPNNWQMYSDTKDVEWNPFQPPAPILQYDPAGNPVLIPNLDAYYDKKFGFPKKLAKLTKPKTPGVGEVWIDTQMEDYAGKKKPGATTKINVENWTIDRKIASPGNNMNNPHNMWTDKDYKYLYQTEWFDNDLDVFDRKTGKLVRNIEVGHNPAHVMTRPGTDKLTVGINAGTDVVELAPGATSITRRIHVDPGGVVTPHPHAHWTSHDGKTVVAPNTMTNEAVIVDMESGTVKHDKVGEFPIATSMSPNSDRAYLSDFLGGSISCVSLGKPACANDKGKKVHYYKIDLWKNYDLQNPATGTWGGLTIQLPVSPDGKAMLAMNTLSQTISVIDPKTNKVVKDLPCHPGCHGGNFGAKKGGGYYGYISNKFSNAAQVVDYDPNGDGKINDAEIAGQLVLGATSDTKVDDKVTAHPGVGGQGVVAIPLVYNGWAQEMPEEFRSKLTKKQLDPIDD